MCKNFFLKSSYILIIKATYSEGYSSQIENILFYKPYRILIQTHTDRTLC